VDGGAGVDHDGLGATDEQRVDLHESPGFGGDQVGIRNVSGATATGLVVGTGLFIVALLVVVGVVADS
jgi:hypothetical protein